MDTVTLVTDQVDDGQKLVGRLEQEKVPVLAAAWAKPLDLDRWVLYVATPLVDEKGITAAYREIYRVLRALGDMSITHSDVTIIGRTHPITADLLDLLRRYPGPLSTNSGQPSLGGQAVEGVYLYAPMMRVGGADRPVVIWVFRDFQVDPRAKTITVIRKKVTLPPGTVVGPPITVEYTRDQPRGRVAVETVEDAIKKVPEGWSYTVLDEE